MDPATSLGGLSLGGLGGLGNAPSSGATGGTIAGSPNSFSQNSGGGVIPTTLLFILGVGLIAVAAWKIVKK